MENLLETVARERIARATKEILEALAAGYGLDISDLNFVDTPKRVAKAYAELFSGLKDTEKQVQEVLLTAFPCNSANMVCVRDIKVFSVCPHHLSPIFYRVAVGYIPSKEGLVLGLSKIPRVVKILARRPVLQEKFTQDVAEAFMSIPGGQGSACRVIGQHTCMMIRGVEQHDAETVTSSMLGVFAEEDAARAEFLSLINKSF